MLMSSRYGSTSFVQSRRQRRRCSTGAAADLRLNITSDRGRPPPSHRLHSVDFDHLGLAALQKPIAEFSDDRDLPVASTTSRFPSPLPSEVALRLFRVVEESLTNIAKHSGARSARISPGSDADGPATRRRRLRLRIRCGRVCRAGLTWFRQHAGAPARHQGTIVVDSAPSRGTRIERCVVPAKSLRCPNPPTRTMRRLAHCSHETRAPDDTPAHTAG